MKKCLLSILALGLLSSFAFAAEKTPEELQQEENHIFAIDGVQQKNFRKLVASGMNTRVGLFNHINPDCTSKDFAVRITKQPEHGTVEVSPTKEYLTYKKDSFYYKCGQHKTQATEIKYKSADKYTGKDELDALILWQGGYAWEVHVEIDVR